MGVRQSHGSSRRSPQRGQEKKKGRRRAPQAASGFGWFPLAASIDGSQAPGASGQGIGGSAPLHGINPPQAPSQVTAPMPSPGGAPGDSAPRGGRQVY
jgi:hypothetical protein